VVKIDPEKLEIRHARIGMGSHMVLAIIVGWLSVTVSGVLGNWLTVVTGFVIVIAYGYVLERFLGKKGIKWWIGNGLFIYLLVWLVAWTFLFNLT
jgi:hypothetical protein